TVRSIRFFDSVLNPYGPTAIVPSGSFTFSFFGPNPPPNALRRDVELKAAIFMDGSSWGDPEWVKVLRVRREAAARFTNKTLETIQATGIRRDTKRSLIERIQEMRANEYRSAQTTAERQMADFIFEDVLTPLKETTDDDEELATSLESVSSVRSHLQVRLNR